METYLSYLTSHQSSQIALTCAILALYWLIGRLIYPKLKESAEDGNFKPEVSGRAKTAVRLIMALTSALLIFLIWGIKFSNILLFSTTMLTLMGEALFAQWSLLSNVTAYFVLLLHPSIKRGNFVRVLDFDNYVEGYVSELSLFNTKLITDSREQLIYPNNLMLSRPIVVNPREKWNPIGKVCPIEAGYPKKEPDIDEP